MKIVLLGSGNVATQLAYALKDKGQEIIQVYSFQLAHAKALASVINCEAVDNLGNITPDADLYIIAVKDDAISDVASKLGAVKGLVVHTSGTTDISILAQHVKLAGVFYPLQTFSKAKPVSFAEIPICIEATDEVQLVKLQEFARELSSLVYSLDGEKRRILHLSAVFACNFTNHLYALANQLLIKNSLDFEIIRPLIAETANKVMNSSPQDVQTGPAAREDERTIKRHLGMLNDLPELQHIYQTLTESIKLTLK
ncbi:Rossmann-like and DUF2520 domain-containing protein [Pedobacter sandarakinus]|uniref:Rossmann-like and DUF2520 domain-containing protein n=1 Tax=Pedobacter sandarakinus TaxID=353156 RepID=UPI0022458896|nr:DUF2520 domain-containing protein [Pedobacter sandarakinus]MCX2575468.1 DUF2520 domain-containing protein [Pedobacter sandarakinus]